MGSYGAAGTGRVAPFIIPLAAAEVASLGLGLGSGDVGCCWFCDAGFGSTLSVAVAPFVALWLVV